MLPILGRRKFELDIYVGLMVEKVADFTIHINLSWVASRWILQILLVVCRYKICGTLIYPTAYHLDEGVATLNSLNSLSLKLYLPHYKNLLRVTRNSYSLWDTTKIEYLQF
jgi:hypothetical protein